MKLLFIHGRSQQGRSSDELRIEWVEALNLALKRLKIPTIETEVVSVPFYGDLLETLSKTSAVPVTAPDLSKRSNDSYDSFLKEFASEIGERHPDLLPDQLQPAAPPSPSPGGAHHLDMQARSAGDFNTRGPQNWWWVIEVVRALDRKFPAVSSLTIENLLHDVNRGIRDKIDAVVRKELSNQPTVVVAHSLGTVVAFNVLRDHGGKVPLLVTVGSPLAMRAVANRLPTPKTIPGAVENWFNAYDVHDIVALNRLAPDDFTTDRPIENHGEVKNFTENHHSIAGYLTDLAVAQKIVSAFREDPK
ncbi:alpha/beta hydrolase [Mesorhizobium sp. M0771]|uniref:alpha/beta hydrolase n=1 Tax=Mesorhizobium sp. M0771 TaxID=2956997 RepID=UPI0033392086